MKHLHLRFHYDPDEIEDSLPAVSRYFINETSGLDVLEHLRLEGGFDLAWCPGLASLKRFKCLELGIIEEAVRCSVGLELDGMKTFSLLEGLDASAAAEEGQVGLLTALLMKEFASGPRMKIWYVESFDDLGYAEINEKFRCPCGERV